MNPSSRINEAPRNIFRMPITCTLALATLAACGGGGSDDVVANIDLNSSLATPRPPTTSTPPNPSVVPQAGAFDCATDALTCVEVASASLQAQASVPVTFGQPFKAGDWQPASQGLVAKVDGAVIPLQTDELSTHRDGSARFAVLSAQLNNLQPGQKRIINLYRGAKSNSAPNVPANPDWNLELEAQVYDANGSVTTLVAQPQTQLVSQIASNSERRLAGAIASEYTVTVPFKNKATGATHPHLTARLHTRLVDGGQRIRTDVVMENTRTWAAAPSNITYSLAIKRNGSTLYTQPKFTHYHHARWHKVIWTGAATEPMARVRHNMPYFIASKAVWNYDLGIKIPEHVLSQFYNKYQKSKAAQTNLGPMANLLMTTAFPNTGGRPEIAPLPQWTAMYLISQDDRMREVMLAHADVAAAVPIHYRDESTIDQPLDLDRYPKVTTHLGTSQPALPAVVNGATIWIPDTAHQGSYTYTPYLITGDAFFLDEMMFWASWNMTKKIPEYRDFGQGLLRDDQVRGQAWTLRALGEVSHALPDSHILKSYFQKRLSNSLEWFYKNWITTPIASVWPMGSPVNPYSYDTVAPWQNDFWAIVMAQLAEAEEPRAKELLNWSSKFGIGRFLNETQGMCLAKAPGYFLKTKNANKNWISSWNEFAQINFPGVACSSDLKYDGYPASGAGSVAMARAMLATASSLGVPDATKAYALWKSKTPLVDKDYPNNPAWAIVPR